MAYVLLAHTGPDGGLESGQPLIDHLQNVAKLASAFAAPVGAQTWAYWIGMLHDAGKASEAFQRRLAGQPLMVDHSTAGARLSCELFGNEVGRLMAFPISGHHGGMPNWNEDGEKRTPLKRRLDSSMTIERYREALGTIVQLPNKEEVVSPAAFPNCFKDASLNMLEREFAIYLTEQVLYSSLVDADWLDTEAFMRAEDAEARTRKAAPLSELEEKIRAHMDALSRSVASGSGEKSPVNAARFQILQDCLDAADSDPGLFTLEVPTGGGKTLASVSFALKHAIRNGQSRVIVAIPYTSIVEQTAATLKDVFGPDNVLEHHSNYDFDETDDAARAHTERLRVQNWDAPIVVTTNVQLFESLFSNKPSRCRKVHNVANAVIILDEAQTLPNHILRPTLAMIQTLATSAHTTTVLCTATQPALDDEWPFRSKPSPLVKGGEPLFGPFENRVAYEYDRCDDDAMSIGELAEAICENEQVLCVVNSRYGARRIFEELYDVLGVQEGTYHLSALMVPEHRSAVIREIRDRLSGHLPCRVVSTQLIEAGVDVDFPMVMREVTGIDSIIQAAGRCNREGKMDRPGRVIVFACPDIVKSPAKRTWLQTLKAIGVGTLRWAARKHVDPFGKESVRHYFQERYGIVSSNVGDGLDSRGILRDIIGTEDDPGSACSCTFSFERYARDYRFIEESGIPVFVPWGSEGEALLMQLESGEASPDFWRRLQRFSVQVPEWILFGTYGSSIRTIDGIHVLETRTGSRKLYSEQLGLLDQQEGELDLLAY